MMTRLCANKNTVCWGRNKRHEYQKPSTRNILVLSLPILVCVSAVIIIAQVSTIALTCLHGAVAASYGDNDAGSIKLHVVDTLVRVSTPGALQRTIKSVYHDVCLATEN